MRPQSTDSSKTMTNKVQPAEEKNLEARVEFLEQHLALSLKTSSTLTIQCKNAAAIIESLSACQLGQQAQIHGIAEALDGIAAAIGMYSDDELNGDDDTWN